MKNFVLYVPLFLSTPLYSHCDCLVLAAVAQTLDSSLNVLCSFRV